MYNIGVKYVHYLFIGVLKRWTYYRTQTSRRCLKGHSMNVGQGNCDTEVETTHKIAFLQKYFIDLIINIYNTISFFFVPKWLYKPSCFLCLDFSLFQFVFYRPLFSRPWSLYSASSCFFVMFFRLRYFV